MLTEILNFRIFYWVMVLSSNLLILDFQNLSKGKMGARNLRPNWELKGIWLLKLFLGRSMMESLLICLLPPFFSLLCTQRAHLSYRQTPHPMVIINNFFKRIMKSFGNFICICISSIIQENFPKILKIYVKRCSGLILRTE